MFYLVQEKKCKKTKTKTGTKDQPEEVPKEAKSWSNRSKTDNSKSEAMGLGRGRDNGLQLLVLSTVMEQMVVVEEVAERVSSASISVCKQGPLAQGWTSHDSCWPFCWLLPVSCKWEGRFLTRLTVTMLLDALVFEFSSSDKSVRCSGLVEAASIFQLDKIKKNQKMKQKTKKKKTHKIKHQHQPNIKEKN